MSKVTVVAVTDGEEWAILQPGDTGADLLPESVRTYEFDNRAKTALSFLQARGRIAEFDLPTDSQGRYNPDAYAIASGATFMGVHCTTVSITSGGKVETINLSEKPLEWIVEEIPALVISAYNRRSNPPLQRTAIKKPLPAGEVAETAAGQEAGSEQETNTESESSETQPGN